MVGMIGSTIASRDRNAAAYNERMSEVRAWLCHHTELPKQLRYRIRRYFERHLSQKAAVDDRTIINDLSPALLNLVSEHIIHHEVRNNILFYDLPPSAVGHLMPILMQKECDANDRLVTKGDAGTEMYILIHGQAVYVEGHQWMPRDPEEVEEDIEPNADGLQFTEILGNGDSFGEEIILGLEEQYFYTICAATQIRYFSISEGDFQNAFNHMPDIISRMKENFQRNARPDMEHSQNTQGRAALSSRRTSWSTIPAAFPDVVLDSLLEIKHSLPSAISSRLEDSEAPGYSQSSPPSLQRSSWKQSSPRVSRNLGSQQGNS